MVIWKKRLQTWLAGPISKLSFSFQPLFTLRLNHHCKEVRGCYRVLVSHVLLLNLFFCHHLLFFITKTLLVFILYRNLKLPHNDNVKQFQYNYQVFNAVATLAAILAPGIGAESGTSTGELYSTILERDGLSVALTTSEQHAITYIKVSTFAFGALHGE
jgi:hypothetical protein